VSELLVGILREYQDSGRLDYDLFDEITDQRIEVKSSRVLRTQKLNLTTYNLYDVIISNSERNRLLHSNNALDETFDCNIQQLKPGHFDTLYYMLFFNDVIEFFRIQSDQIESDHGIRYADKQHRGNQGEGQFHINQTTYQHHKENYFLESVTYEKIKEMLLDKKEEYYENTKQKD